MSRRPLRLSAAALLLAAGTLATAAAAQDPLCPRWRQAFASMPVQMVTVESKGRTIAVRVRVARAGEQRAAGFQCATREEIERSLILFDFGEEIHTQFHMQNVPAALDIAFAKADGRISAIRRMDPGPTALYGPLGGFRYALEARAGFYESQGLRQGRARLVIPPAR